MLDLCSLYMKCKFSTKILDIMTYGDHQNVIMYSRIQRSLVATH